MDNPQVVFLKYFNLKFGIYSNGDVYNFDGLEPKKLKFYVRKDGYAHFIFNNKIFYHHRIIAKAFIPNPHNYLVINHIDGNKLNNCAENLEWCSISHNNLDAEKRGKKYSLEMPRGRKKSKEEGILIYNYILNNFSTNNTQLAKKLNTSRTTIRYYKRKILNDYPEMEYTQASGNSMPYIFR